MICVNCESENSEGAAFCLRCGNALIPSQGFESDVEVIGLSCSNCGTKVGPDARFCPNCGAVTDPQESGGPAYAPGVPYAGGLGYVNVPNYLVWAILVTICCCVPTGIVAIIYAAQVNSKLSSGDYAGAVRYSNSAKTWCWVSLGLGIASVVIGLGLGFVMPTVDDF